jgi:NAD(P)-dependent dehydrogenase (short-subunit alcohol dehydrogenase family)
MNSPVVLLTGASRGLGAAIARVLGRTGAAVGLLARNRSRLEQVAEAIAGNGGQALILPADVADAQGCAQAVDQTLTTFGRLDALINNAAQIEPLAPVASVDPADWRRNIEVGLLGPLYLMQAAMTALRHSRGRIINVSSGAAQRPLEGLSAYCTAKAGLTHLTQVVAAEEHPITCLAVRPGVVDTQMQSVLRDKGPGTMPRDSADYYIRLKADNQLEPPHVPARSIAWLALHAPHEWSGAFLNYDDEAVMMPASQRCRDW